MRTVYSSSGLIKSFALFHDCCCWAVLMCKTATQISISILLLFRSLLLMMQCFIYCQQSLPHCQQHFESPTFWRENSTKIKETFFKRVVMSYNNLMYKQKTLLRKPQQRKYYDDKWTCSSFLYIRV